MNVYRNPKAMKKADLTPTGTVPNSHKVTADIFDDLANHGRFDEDGGELSQADWEDVIAR